MTHDYQALTDEQLERNRELIRQLDDDQWNVPSLCTGWRVAEVFAHGITGYSIPLIQAVWLIARARGNVGRVSNQVAVDYANTHTREEAVADFVRVTSVKPPKGFVKTVRTVERYPDHLIHEFDVRIPLGIERDVSREQMIPALDAARQVGGFAGYKGRIKGLTLIATDVDYSTGEGPEVRGPALSLLLAASGRPIGLDRLQGDGLATLADRVKS